MKRLTEPHGVGEFKIIGCKTIYSQQPPKNKYLACALAKLFEMENLQDNNTASWISVEDRLPEDGQPVWVAVDCDGDYRTREAIYLESEFLRDRNISVKAKAWMPRFIPEPFAPDREDAECD